MFFQKSFLAVLAGAIAAAAVAPMHAQEIPLGQQAVAEGERLYRARRGPRHASLEQCDFGQGPGVLLGAAAALPRHFADTGRVEDLESRLVTCLSRLQGLGEEALPRLALVDPRLAEVRKLAAFVASQSSGTPIGAPLEHPREVEAYRVGERLFHRRAGPQDYSCATCHAGTGRQMHFQPLPDFSDRDEAQAALTAWPAARASAGEVHTLQDRIAQCYGLMRHPQLRHGSEVSIALQAYLAQQGKDGILAVPGVRR